MSYCMVISRYDDKVEVENIAKQLVEARLGAACQIISGVENIYMCEGKIESRTEYILQVETVIYLAEKVEELILKNHSYKTPEVIKMNIDDGNIEYLKWIDCSINKKCRGC